MLTLGRRRYDHVDNNDHGDIDTPRMKKALGSLTPKNKMKLRCEETGETATPSEWAEGIAKRIGSNFYQVRTYLLNQSIGRTHFAYGFHWYREYDVDEPTTSV